MALYLISDGMSVFLSLLQLLYHMLSRRIILPLSPIIDGSGIFIDIPSDLHVQSSTWSYKHHNTAKFLVACTPNGAISNISPLYVGSVSDVELTRVSGFLEKIEDKRGVSVMADRGFRTQDHLEKINVKFNISPILEGHKQMLVEEIEKGRKIASVHLHIEQVIGLMKSFAILRVLLSLKGLLSLRLRGTCN